MKKYIAIWMITLFLSVPSFADFVNSNNLSGAIQNLFYAYKTQDYKNGIQYTTGKMEQVFSTMISLQSKKQNSSQDSFYSSLKSFIILDKAQKNNLAAVSLFWVSERPSRFNTSATHTKVRHVDYLLENVDGQWKVKDGHFEMEFTLHNKNEVNQIQQQIAAEES